MNTTAAALQANVTTATIRTWCRKGVVAAIKQAGRWIIDTTSLAHRITIGTLKRKQAAMEAGEYRINDETTIRVFESVIPAYGEITYHAEKRINGYKTAGGSYSGSSLQHAYDLCLSSIREDEERNARIGALTDAGVLADLTGNDRARSLDDHMEGLTGTPSHAVPGKCHHCGLNSRTCDCY